MADLEQLRQEAENLRKKIRVSLHDGREGGREARGGGLDTATLLGTNEGERSHLIKE